MLRHYLENIENLSLVWQMTFNAMVLVCICVAFI